MVHRLRVAEVIAETADAHSLVLTVPPALATEFAYLPGQYLTVMVPGTGARCYSLSSSPHTDTDLKITVKRVRDGRGSNWICDHVRAGETLEFLPPAGEFTPGSLDEDLILLAAGSGITPVMGIIKSVLARGHGRLTLIYANRDEHSIIFGRELAALAGDRLTVTHWLDSERGAPDPAVLAALLAEDGGRSAYICGPEPFVAVARDALQRAGVPEELVNVERFEVGQDESMASTLEVEIDGQTRRLPWPAGKRMLDVIIEAGLNPPFSCRQGHCGACTLRLQRGKVDLVNNEILEQEDFDEGYTLACQAIARSDEVAVTYY
ncbi:3-ketosteroid 9alpha-monooxygenase subunit B [Actinoplanes tereljensis]|uniref:Oxidoreductase n=1 Tax=Paractinoplanes tereljensis TaxID=571912 RepID=A0A919TWF3_9ACTN|nr:ferredoxin--NADP reductase [Actinoplanes tereljensis]GIF22822.1 putative oxidoreductase [Actinoplanes tereljensis]